jgi:beta-D-xylosidase 4
MCNSAVDGIPSCANEYLLQTVLRESWDFSASYNWVVSDCDAISNVYGNHHYTSSLAAAAAVSLNAGTDLDCGSTYSSLTSALLYNMTTEATLDRSLLRLYSSLIQVGWFDEESSQYGSLSWANVNTAEARTLAYQAAVEGITLLKNNGILPLLNLSSKVTLIGPWANATAQMQGNYYGTAPYLISPLQAFKAHLSNVTYEEGTAVNSNSTAGFSSALTAATQSDYIVYLGGIDTSIEAEGMDRSSIVWPGNQLNLIAQLAELGKPLIVVQCGGGQIDDSALLANSNVSAILWAGYPGQEGGNAIFDVITGNASVAGRLPVTQYPANYTGEVTMYQMDLRPNSSYPGRTYKWYDQTPVLPFGHGLHYSNFSLSWASTPRPVYSIHDLVGQASGQYKALAPFTNVAIDAKNTGGRGNLPSDYVGLLFISTTNGGPAPYPNKELVSYGRLHNIAAHSSQRLTLPITLGSLARTDTEGNSYLYPGTYKLAVDIDAKITFEFSLIGAPALIESLPKNPSNASAFEYLGCFADTSNTTVWTKTINLGTSNYPQLCVDQCKLSGYYYSGVQRS